MYSTTGIPKGTPENPVFIDYVGDGPDSRYAKDGTLKPWADPLDEESRKEMKFNKLDGKVDRRSVTGRYEVVDSWPVSPLPKTSVKGPGVLGRLGPNHAVDPVVMQLVPTGYGNFRVFVVLIKRKDTGEWALPGGMVDPGESVTATLRREFAEEASGNQLPPDLKERFLDARKVMCDTVDDPRNTDNAWMETTVMLVDATGLELRLRSGSDAADVAIAEIVDGRVMVRGESVALYASHKKFLSRAAECLLDLYERGAYSAWDRLAKLC